MTLRYLNFFVLLIFCVSFAFAQSSGKIMGLVTDKSSGEPLPGVNVDVEGTNLSAATDKDGYYVIFNVPAGVYNVRASFINYRGVIQKNVRVNADKIKELNFALEESAIIEFTADIQNERRQVEKHIPRGFSLITAEDLQTLPVRGFTETLKLQNSVVLQDNEFHIRGSRPDEIGYYIDGVSSNDPFSNAQELYVIPEALAEIQVLPGGYGAEYGNANGGVILSALKTGGPALKATIDFQTDKFAGEGEQFLSSYSYRHHTGVATLGGPLLSKNIRFFIAGENRFRGDRAVRFSDGFTLGKLEDEARQRSRDTTIASYAYPDGFTPKQEDNLLAFQGTLLFDYAPLQIRLSGTWNRLRQQNTSGISDDTPMLDMLNERFYDDIFNRSLFSATLSYAVSPKALASATVGVFHARDRREDSYFGDNWHQWYDSTAVAQHTNGQVIYQSRWQPEGDYRFNGWNFARNGDPAYRFFQNDQNRLDMKFNFTYQVNRFHEAKIGVDVQQFTLRSLALNPHVMETLDFSNVEKPEDVPLYNWINFSQADNIGYDIYGNRSEKDEYRDGFKISEAPKKPKYSSVYLRDKMEYKDLVIDAGLRYDHFNTRAQHLVDPENPDFDPRNAQLREDAFETVEAFNEISPRLGVSLAPDSGTVLFAHFGKYAQMPRLDLQYASARRYSRDIVGGGNFVKKAAGYALKPVKTTVYELGLRKQISGIVDVTIAGYYRNTNELPTLTRVNVNPEAYIAPYNLLTNGDYANTKGVDVMINLRRVRHLQAQVNYTFSKVRGGGSNPFSFVTALELETGLPTLSNPLDYQQTHRGSIDLDYRFGNNEGGFLFKNFGVNALATFNNGHPFTFSRGRGHSVYGIGVEYMDDTRGRTPLEEINASTTPGNFDIDLRLDKAFDISKFLQATFYVRVTNLLNRRNVLNVYDATGRADDDGVLSTGGESPFRFSRDVFIERWGEDWVNMHEAINLINGQAYWDVLGKELWGHPRQIFFGINLSY